MPALSLSARRAWIEIEVTRNSDTGTYVALRKESVDRNFHAVQIVIVVVRSLSARRAWIEMLIFALWTAPNRSLSARRAWIEMVKIATPPILLLSLSARRAWIEMPTRARSRLGSRSRSPQGERG